MAKTISKVLVTGAAGYLGDAVIEELDNKNHEVVAIDNLTYRNSYLRDVEFYNMDVLGAELECLIQFGKFDAIIHLAALVGDGACKINESLTRAINVGAVEHIVNSIIKHSPHTRLIFSSTCSIFGASEKDEELNAQSPTNPLSLYASTKLEAENIIRDKLDDYVIYRLGTLYGLSTEHARIRTDLVANIMTYKAVENALLTVFGGDQWRPLIHARDVAACLSDIDIRFQELPRILATSNTKIKDLAEKIIAVTGSSSKIVETPAKFEDLRNYKVVLPHGISNKISLADGIREMALAYRSGRIKNPWLKDYNNTEFMKELHGST